MKSKTLVVLLGAATLTAGMIGCSRDENVSTDSSTTTVAKDVAPDSDDTNTPDRAGTPPIDALGMPLSEAETYLEDIGYTVRVVQQDDEVFITTQDYRTDRINLIIQDEVVTEAYIG